MFLKRFRNISPTKGPHHGSPDRVRWLMAVVEYQTIDGLTVRLTYDQWVEHISPRHPEVTFDDVNEALTQATRICAHKELATRRIYEGHPRGRSLHHTEIPIVVVQLDSEQTGWVVRPIGHRVGIKEHSYGPDELYLCPRDPLRSGR